MQEPKQGFQKLPGIWHFPITPALAGHAGCLKSQPYAPDQEMQTVCLTQCQIWQETDLLQDPHSMSEGRSSGVAVGLQLLQQAQDSFHSSVNLNAMLLIFSHDFLYLKDFRGRIQFSIWLALGTDMSGQVDLSSTWEPTVDLGFRDYFGFQNPPTFCFAPLGRDPKGLYPLIGPLIGILTVHSMLQESFQNSAFKAERAYHPLLWISSGSMRSKKPGFSRNENTTRHWSQWQISILALCDPHAHRIRIKTEYADIRQKQTYLQ